MEEMRRHMDALFGNMFGFDLPDLFGRRVPISAERRTEIGMEPDVDIYEHDNEFVIQAALPGINPQDIQVEATENGITLSAESQSGSEMPTQEQTETSQTGQRPPIQHRQSRYSSQSRFYFSYQLPTEIKPNEVRAEFRNGMLELHLPKSQPQTSKAIPVTIHSEGKAQGRPTDQTREGAPTSKMGQSYAPSAGEDHTTQAQTVGERIEGHQRRDETASTAIGQTNPSQSQMTTSTGSNPPTGTRQS
jgi:HSP20 family protein